MKRSAKWLRTAVVVVATAALLCLLIAFLVTKKQENRGGPCSPLNPTQAVMRIEDGKTTPNLPPFLLDSGSPDVSLTDVLAVLGTPKAAGE